MNKKGIIAPTVSKPTEKKGVLKFKLENVNYSVANAIRRTILSDIDTVVLKTSPIKDNLIVIYENTSRFHNEILKQRLNCIPVHIKNVEQNLNNLVVEVNVENNTESIMYVTTKDFKIKDVKTDKYLNEEQVKEIFPPNKITKEYILFLRLRPKISQNIPGEKIHLEVKLSVSNSMVDGAFNVASTCAYGYTGDVIKQNDVWNETAKKLMDGGMSDKEINMEKKNWFLHEAKRYYLENSFDFTVESVGVYSNSELMMMGCDVLINKCNIFYNLFEQDKIEILKDETILEYSHDIVLKNEDYTLGKVIEFLLHDEFYRKQNILSYVGFIKKHPHDDYSIVRIAFNDKEHSNRDNIRNLFKNVLITSKNIFEHIKDYFNRI